LKTSITFTVILLAALSTAPVPVSSAQDGGREIRLVLQVTVDGLRADLLTRDVEHFGNSGFRYLLENGSVFANAHYQHANTETIVGHATLATGAQPAVHGMVGNVWYDAPADALSYNIEDPAHLPLSVRAAGPTGEQVDPAQRQARTAGRSPRALLAETLDDKLLRFSAGRSKIFAVSGKDRDACHEDPEPPSDQARSPTARVRSLRLLCGCRATSL
jgi:hypothetical protein